MKYGEMREHVRKIYSDLLQRRREALSSDGPPDGTNAIAYTNTRDLIDAPSEEYWTLVGEDDAARHLRWFAEQSGLAVETVVAEREKILPEIHKALRSVYAELESAREGLGHLDLGTDCQERLTNATQAPPAIRCSSTLCPVSVKPQAAITGSRRWPGRMRSAIPSTKR
jgi:hypothetical protein